MTDRELPEDIFKWPRDPFQLLGVTKDVDHKELKRSYTRLIKRFKPEQFPEQFRLLREAYDQIQQFVQYRQVYEERPDEVAYSSNPKNIDDVVSSLDSIETVEPLGKSHVDEGERHTFNTKSEHHHTRRNQQAANPPIAREHRVVLSPIEEAIRIATSGDLISAIALLQKYRRSRNSEAESETIQALEFWIAKLSKQNPSSLNPRDLIRQQLESGNLSDSAMQNAKIEQIKDPKLLCNLPLEKLYCNTNHQQDFFLYSRWQSAHRSGQFRLIMEDCKWLNEHYFDNLVRWLFLSYQAVQHLLWSEELEVIHYGMGLVKQLNEEHLSLPGYISDLTRLDLLINTTMCLYEYMKKPHANRYYWLLMGICWNSIEPECREQSLQWMITLENNLSNELAALDSMFQIQPQLIEILVRNCLHVIRGGLEEEADDESNVQLDSVTELTIKQFLSQLDSTDYDHNRLKVLQFCNYNSISPQLIINAFQKRKSRVYAAFAPSFLQNLASDYVALSVYRILRHFDKLKC